MTVLNTFRRSRFYWIGLKSQLFGAVIKMSKLIFATLALRVVFTLMGPE